MSRLIPVLPVLSVCLGLGGPALADDAPTQKSEIKSEKKSENKSEKKSDKKSEKGGGKVCKLEISGNDQMQWDKPELVVEKTCAKVEVTLKHTGKLDKQVMGHNWVLVEAKDLDSVAQDGLKAGKDANFLPKADIDSGKIFAHAPRVIGGGETVVFSFDVSKMDRTKDWRYECTFPGHNAIMKGKWTFK